MQTYALQVVQGRRFGMNQSPATQWSHVLLPVLLTALRALGAAPARSLCVLAPRLGVSVADAASIVSAPAAAPASGGAPTAPFGP